MTTKEFEELYKEDLDSGAITLLGTGVYWNNITQRAYHTTDD